ncbi:MAG: AAA family ATPase [Fibrobacter sp.]|nr:AAA family ATPase [Fibrobacter sp.]
MTNTVALSDIVLTPWNSVLELVRSECDDYFGATILDTVEFEGFEGGFAYLIVPDELRENWVNTHYGSILRKACGAVFGAEFVDYKIRQAERKKVPEINLSASVPMRPRVAKPVATTQKAKPRSRLKLYPNYTFENFIEGDCNSVALRACQSVAENPGNPDLNPLFVYGDSGLGKTHLLHSIAAQLQKNRKMRVVYSHALDFLNEATAMAKAMRLKSGNVRELAEAFQEKYENCDILLLDDVQLLEKAFVIQERLAVLIKHLRMLNKQVVLSCDRHPSCFTGVHSRMEMDENKGTIPCISAKLLAPLESCVAVGLDKPDIDTCLRVIQKKSVTIPFVDRDREEIYRFLSRRPRQNFRVIEGMLNWLGAMNDLCQQNLDLNTVKSLVNPEGAKGHGELTIKDIAEIVAAEFGIDCAVLSSKKQNAKISLPRKIAMYLCREMTNETLQKVGIVFNRDYATVIAAINSLQESMEKDESLKQRVQDIHNLLEA